MSREVTLEEYLRKIGGVRYTKIKNVYRKVLEGELVLEDPKPPKSFSEVFARLDYTLWYWTVILATIATIALIALPDLFEPIRYARYALGVIYVLFLPGYTTVEALYPEEGSLKPLERLALSIGLSLAVVPLLGLVLNYTLSIRLWPVTLTIAAYIIAMSTIALYRKHAMVRLVLEAREHRRKEKQ